MYESGIQNLSIDDFSNSIHSPPNQSPPPSNMVTKVKLELNPSKIRTTLRKIFCRDLFKKMFAIIVILISTFINLLMLIFKGETNYKSAFFANLGGIQIALFVFLFYRRKIQSHIRRLLELKDDK